MAFTQVEMMAALLKYETLVLDRMSSFLPTNAYYHPVIAAQEIRVQMAEQLLQLAVQHSPHHNKQEEIKDG